METVKNFLDKMYGHADFVYTVNRDFVKELRDARADPAG